MYNDAYLYYHLAQVLAIETKDSCSLRTYTYSLAMTLYRQQRYEQSAYRFNEAYRQSQKCPEDFNVFYFRQELLDNIGLCYNAIKKYDSAIVYYNKALAYLREKNGRFPNKPPHVYESAMAVVYGNMAEVYVHQQKYDSAKLLYEHSIKINLQKGYTNSDALIDQVKLADLYFLTGDIAAAKTTLDLVKIEQDTIPDKRVEMMWHKLMWQYCEQAHDSVNAFRHLRKYMLQNEAFAYSNKALMETDLDMRVRDLEKQYRIDKLIVTKQHQKTYIVIITIFAVMAVAIVFLVLRNTVRNQRSIKQLTKLNNQVSEQKKQLELTLEKLQIKEKDNSRILKSVAHDVMSPIAAVVSLADILISDNNAGAEEQKEIFNLIKEAGTNSLNLSKDILEASRDINDTTQKKEKADINSLVTKSVELMNYKALLKQQTIKTSMPAEPIFAVVYEDKIRRVINNILSNAIKFSHTNSTIEVTLEQKAQDVHISIKDTGIGIPEKNKPFVFDMFTDVKAAGTAGEMPNGLGLSISLQIARAHKGDIWFESKEGVGTTFHLVFPVEG